MPLNVDDLLPPIPGENPSGADLRYEPVYDEIKDARRQDDETPQGDWAHERKVAEWPIVIRLTTAAIAKQSKDLQLAAWLTEALLKQEGFSGLRGGLALIQGLLEKYWDTLYPQIEDGDAELRAAPLSWLGLKLDGAVKSVALVRAGYDLFKYNESQTIVGYEASVADDSKKAAERNQKIEEGKLSGEEWDKAFAETPKAFYKALVGDLDASLKLVAAIDKLGDKFGDVAPSYSQLKKALEEVLHVSAGLLRAKLAIDPDPVEEAPAEGAAGEAEVAADTGSLAAEPVHREDAVNRVVSAARFLRRAEPANPASYLLLRGLRWGEVRASAGPPEPRILIAPTTQLRSQLKSLLLDGKWAALLEACEIAMGQTCGRGWLDLQRYTIVACSRLGKEYYAVETAMRNALRAFLADVPQIAEVTMMDDTPTANAETRQWIAEEIQPALNGQPAPPEPGVETDEGSPEALEMARSGRTEEAVEMITRQLEQERSLRGRFRRRTQLAAILVDAGQDAIARPILEDLVTQIENYKLEEWESGQMVAQPLTLLYRVLHKLEGDPDTRQALYLRICRLDPIQALRCPQ